MVEMLAWESFGAGWVTDVVKQLKIDAEVKTADYGQIVDLASIDFNNDVVFTWNGTTSGVRVPNGDWIADDRAGLTICDATSAAFAMDVARAPAGRGPPAASGARGSRPPHRAASPGRGPAVPGPRRARRSPAP